MVPNDGTPATGTKIFLLYFLLSSFYFSPFYPDYRACSSNADDVSRAYKGPTQQAAATGGGGGKGKGKTGGGSATSATGTAAQAALSPKFEQRAAAAEAMASSLASELTSILGGTSEEISPALYVCISAVCVHPLRAYAHRTFCDRARVHSLSRSLSCSFSRSLSRLETQTASSTWPQISQNVDFSTP